MLKQKQHQKHLRPEEQLKQTVQQQKIERRQGASVNPSSTFVTVVGNQNANKHCLSKFSSPSSSTQSISVDCTEAIQRNKTQLSLAIDLPANVPSMTIIADINSGENEEICGVPDPSPLQKLLVEKERSEKDLVVELLPLNNGNDDMNKSFMNKNVTNDLRQNDHKRMRESNVNESLSKRRCMTSLGVLHAHKNTIGEHNLKNQTFKSSSESRARPLSCPILHHATNFVRDTTCEINSYQENDQDSISREIYQLNHDTIPKNKQCNNTTEDRIKKSSSYEDMDQKKKDIVRAARKTQAVSFSSDKIEKNSFHFVQKPTVIAVRHPNTSLMPSVMSCPNFNSCQKSESEKDSPKSSSEVQQTHNILNSLLVSEGDSHTSNPDKFNSISLSASLTRLSRRLDNNSIGCDSQGKRASNKQAPKSAHTLDNAYLLSMQSNRSAFVPVARDKIQDLSQNKGTCSHPCLNIHSQSRSESTDRLNKENRQSTEIPMESDIRLDSSHIENKDTCSSASVQNVLTNNLSSSSLTSDHFKPIAHSTLSQSDTPISSVIGQSSSISQNMTSSSSLSSSSSPVSLIKTAQKVSTNTVCNNTKSVKLTSKSPVTPPRRPTRSRFTPIRPKVNTTCSISPQKKDMRPVATLLKEQRVQNAQQLLLNLATTYQGEVKLQIPSELSDVSPKAKYATSASISSKILSSNVSDLTSKNLHASWLLPLPTSNSISNTRYLSQNQNAVDVGAVLSTTTGETTMPSNQAPGICNINRNKLVIADNSGMVYTLEKDSEPLCLMQSKTNMDNSSSKSEKSSSIVNIADINGQVIGPDDKGQKYLIVPSSNFPSQTIPENQITSKNMGQRNPVLLLSTAGLPVSMTGKKQQIMSSMGDVSSSAALLSELSQLASKQGKAQLQTLIQHDSELSAFHKCDPKKQLNIRNSARSDASTQAKNTHLKPSSIVMENRKGNETDIPLNTISVTDNTTFVSKKQVSEQMIIPNSIRKRKASKGRDLSMKEKKRQNTNDGDEKQVVNEDVVIVDVEEESMISQDDIPSKDENMARQEQKPREKEKIDIDISDTDTLLQMIVGSKSLTVKQTVLALNSLKAKMNKRRETSNTYINKDKMSTDFNDLQENTKYIHEIQSEMSESNNIKTFNDVSQVHQENTSSEFLIKNIRESNSKPALVSCDQSSNVKNVHINRRNTSLNVESLESDALLDNEPTLDHRLVSDVKDRKSRKSESSKMSVAVFAKASQMRKKEFSEKEASNATSKCHNTALSPKSFPIKVDCKQNRNMEKGSNGTDFQRNLNQAPMLPRRSLSCIPDMQDKVPTKMSPIKKHYGSNSIEGSSGVEDFDALFSKMQSKWDENRQKTQQSRSDLDIPIDVIDFVTESMTCRSNNLSARCVSVPNTRPDFFKIGASLNVQATSPKLLSLEIASNASKYGTSQSQEFLDLKNSHEYQSKGENLIGEHSDEVGVGDKQSVFLSPVGPAKLARRLSVERASISQSPVDGAMAKTPVDFFPSRHGVGNELSPVTKVATGAKGQNTCRLSPQTSADKLFNHPERKRAKTPFDMTTNIQVCERRCGKSLPVSQSSEEFISTKTPVSRSLSQTPIDKFFHKIVSDSLLAKYPNQVESITNSRDQLSGQDEFTSSQTPTSDAGYSSVRETPVSDFGYNSISPSPVMMSSSTFFGECGRREITSPATIFMPLRSDSALSNVNHDNLFCPSQTNLSEILPSISNQCNNENFLERTDKNERDILTLSFIPSDQGGVQILSTNSSNENQSLNRFSGRKNNEDGDYMYSHDITENSLEITSNVSHSSIPTPPFSPNSFQMSSASTKALQFNIPFSPVPNHESSPSPSTIPKFVLPCPSNVNNVVTSSSMSPVRRSGSRDHVLTPSPHILARPPSSPHQFGPHSSPPFTPCSLPSPCPTPLSFKSIISPRSLTPSLDSTHAPNGFMPIQSSCVQTVPVTPTHSYIQPIKPLVTLASLSPSSQATVATDRSHFVSVTSRQESSPGFSASSLELGSQREGRTLSYLRQSNLSLLSLGRLQEQLPSTVPDCRNLQTSKDPHLNMPQSLALPKGLTVTQCPERYVDHNDGDLFRRRHNSKPRSCSATTKAFQSKFSSENHQPDLSTLLRGDQDKSICPLSIEINNRNSGQPIIYSSKTSSSLFSAVPSKLQVDLTKLEESQNATSTVIHSAKLVTTNQYEKINLDNCDTFEPSVQISLPEHSENGSRISSRETKLNNQPSKVMPMNILCETEMRNKDQQVEGYGDASDNAMNVNCQSNYSINRHHTASLQTNSVRTAGSNMWNQNLSQSSCQIDLQATLEVLRDIDSQYFPSDEDNSNSGSSAVDMGIC